MCVCSRVGVGVLLFIVIDRPFDRCVFFGVCGCAVLYGTLFVCVDRDSRDWLRKDINYEWATELGAPSPYPSEP